MSPYLLIGGGAAAMILGTLLLGQYLPNTHHWLGAGVIDRPGATKTDRQYLDLYFTAYVIAPLLSGAVMILLGLRQLLCSGLECGP
jgi:hypothetical protein